MHRYNEKIAEKRTCFCHTIHTNVDFKSYQTRWDDNIFKIFELYYLKMIISLYVDIIKKAPSCFRRWF